MHTHKIWDIYTRLFHWLFATSIVLAIIFAEIDTTIHFNLAKFITFLLIFRIIWGFIGYNTARFTHFFPTPKRLKKYFQGNYTQKGHNPIGALSIFAMLGLVFLQIFTGLFTTDEILFEAPFYASVDTDVQEFLQEAHDVIGSLLQILILLHISAIIIYKLKGKALVKDMISGGKTDQDFGVKQWHIRAIVSIFSALLITYVIFG